MSAPLRRPPSAVLAVDTNIILSVVLGRRSRSLFERVSSQRIVVTSGRVAVEVWRVLAHFPHDAALAEALLGEIEIAEEELYAGLIDNATRTLRHAVASRNGSTTDAHLLACAWAFDADIWSHDRDFAGTGWPSWSNANLAEAVETGG